MGSGISSLYRTVKLTNDKCFKTDSNRNKFKLVAVILTKDEVDAILDLQESGTYILYEDVEKKQTILAFKTAGKKISHYQIIERSDGLFSFNDFIFPYLESIVLYYQKYKFKDTKLTKQAYLEPYLCSQQAKREPVKSLSSSEDTSNDEHEQENAGKHEANAWIYGRYTSLSIRL